MTTTVDRLVEEYLDQLEGELKDLPRARRRELVGEIAQHIADGHAESEVEMRTLLDRLGEPAEIAEEARERFGVQPPERRRSRTTLETLALLLLLPGSVIIPLVGWLAGVVLLWVSNVWTVRDKLIGTFLVPGGLFTSLLIMFGAVGSEVCSNDGCTGGGTGPVDVLLIAAVFAPFVTTGYLAWRLKRARA